MAFAAAVAFTESCLYAVMAPLLPQLAERLDISDSTAGLLSAAYPAGIVLGVLGAGFAAARDPRRTAIAGMWCIAIACIAFGLGRTEEVLIPARLVQGIGSVAAWAGALTWVVRETAPGARGANLGATIGAALAGSIVAPLLALAAGLGAHLAVFVALAVAIGAVAAWGGPANHLSPDARRSERPATRPAATSRTRRLAEPAIVMLLFGIGSGLCTSLGALSLADMGVSEQALAAVFLVAFVPCALLSSRIGRACDRYGPEAPTTICLLALGIALVAIPLASGPALAAVAVCVTAALATAGWPVGAALASARAGADADQGMAMALVNGAWAGGAAGGAVGSTALAASTADLIPYLIAAAACAVGASYVALRRPDARAPLDDPSRRSAEDRRLETTAGP